MPLPHDDPRLSDYLALCRRRWRTVALTTLLVVLTAVAYGLLRPLPQESVAYISLPAGEQSSPTDPQLELLVLQSPEVAEAAEQALGRRYEIEAARAGDAPVLSVTAAAGDGDTAARIANAYAEAYIAARNKRELARLLAGQESLEARLDEITAAPAGAGATVDPQALRELRLAADLLADAATSGRLAAVEVAAQQLREAASTGGTEDALALVREARIRQLLDEVAVAVDTAVAGGPQLAVPADPDRARRPGGLRSVLPVALVVGVLIGAAVALLRELNDRKIRSGADLRPAADGPPVIMMSEAGAGVDALRATMILGMPQGGVVQVAAVTAGAEQPVVSALASSLTAGGREVRVLDARDAQPAEGAEQVEVPVTSLAFEDLLQQARGAGRYVLVLSPPLASPGNGIVLARAVDGTLLVVSGGVDERADVQAAERWLAGALGQLVATVLVSRAVADVA
jgi:hypothetical protein